MTAESVFDPTAALAGPPDPWESTSTPSARRGPPFRMTEMIAAEPALARRVLERLGDRHGRAAELAEAVRRIAAKYHDESAEGGRWYRVIAVSHPRPAGKEASNE
jgi:hypothetical protein